MSEPKEQKNELMKTDIAAQQLSGLVDEKTLRDFLMSSGTASKLTEAQQNLFLLTAKAMNLNPLKREIYAIPYVKKGLWNKKDLGPGDFDMSIVTGYETYLKRAERAKVDNVRVYDGYEVEFLGKLKVEKKEKKYKDDDGKWQTKEIEMLVSEDKDDQFRCVVKIYRKDRTRPTIHVAYWEECTQGNEMWNTKPRSQLRKVALSQGFRLAFPDEVDGMPYSEDEVPVDHGIIIDTPAADPQKMTPAAALSAPDPEKAKLASLRDEIKDIAHRKSISDVSVAKSVAKQFGGRTLDDLNEEELLRVKDGLENYVPKTQQ